MLGIVLFCNAVTCQPIFGSRPVTQIVINVLFLTVYNVNSLLTSVCASGSDTDTYLSDSIDQVFAQCCYTVNEYCTCLEFFNQFQTDTDSFPFTLFNFIVTIILIFTEVLVLLVVK